MSKSTSKLYRNLKPGDQFTVETGAFTSCAIKQYRSHVVTVTSVQETKRAWFSGKRQWAIYGNYPWWFSGPVLAYAGDRVDLIE